MALLYKIDNNWVSEALIPLHAIYSLSEMNLGNSYLNIFISNDIAMGLSTSSNRITYKHNDIVLDVKKTVNQSRTWNISYVARPSIENGFVGWNGTLDPVAVFKTLTGITVNIPNNARCDIQIEDGRIDFMFDGSTTTIEVNETSVLIGGISQGVNFSYVKDDLTLSGITSEVINKFANPYDYIEKIELETPTTPYDLSFTKIDFSNKLFKEEEIIIDKDLLKVDDYGMGHYSASSIDFNVSQHNLWFPSEKEQYMPGDQFMFVTQDKTNGDVFAEFNKDDLKASINTDTLYDEAYITCSEKTYIGYMKVYSSYIYLDYYYIKKKDIEEECAVLADSPTFGRACRLRITSSSITMMNIDKTLDHIELTPLAQSSALEIFKKARYGIGCFKSRYKIYSYEDNRSRIKVVYNRQSSSKYYELVIEDQATRYLATFTSKVGRRVSRRRKMYARYSQVPEWYIGYATYVNIPLKRAFDNISDTAETVFTNASLTLEPDTIKIFSAALYVNILDVVYTFPQQNLTFNTLAVFSYNGADGLISLQANFQPASGAIYGRVQQGSKYDYYDKDQLEKLLSELNPEYKFRITCNISQLVYEDLSGANHSVTFSNSAMIIAEIAQGRDSEYFRVYYKNIDSYGFINAKKYEVTE